MAFEGHVWCYSTVLTLLKNLVKGPKLGINLSISQIVSTVDLNLLKMSHTYCTIFKKGFIIS